jgi:hypothetical protein
MRPRRLAPRLDHNPAGEQLAEADAALKRIDRAVSRLYGAVRPDDGKITSNVEYRRQTLVLDERLRIVARVFLDSDPATVTLTVAAAATKTLKIGTGVCLVQQRDPIQTAKLVASIDQVSGGRFLFGIGGGWNAEEMEHHGTPFGERWKILRERIADLLNADDDGQ